MVLFAAFVLVSSLAQGTHRGPSVFTLTGSQHGHQFSVRFVQENFKARGRKIVWVKYTVEGQRMYLPGERIGKKNHAFLGWDTLSEEDVKGKSALKALEKWDTELVSLRVKVDGRTWPVRPSLYRPIINPNLPRPTTKVQDHLQASISQDGRTLKVRLLCSDGAGGYAANWIFRRNGKHKLKITGLY